MNFSETTAESFSNAGENGGASTESDRPLKKARFAWQVKGKHHCKGELSESAITSKANSKTENSEGSPGNDGNLSIVSSDTNSNLFENIMKQDLNSLESESSLKHYYLPSNVNSNGQNQIKSKCVNSFDLYQSLNKSGESSPILHSNTIPTFVEDECILRWQLQQVDKCYLDNTINTVLETWSDFPIPSRYMPDDDLLVFPQETNIENEGILMAISAHGLQNNMSARTDDKDSTRSLELSESPDIKSDAMQTETAINKTGSDETSGCQLGKNIPQKATTSFALLEEKSCLTYKVYESQDPNSNIHINENLDETNEFLNTAIMYAIQNQGLTTFGNDYG